MSDTKDIFWCEKHKLQTRPTFLCYLYDVAPGVDAKNTPAKEMKCENCINCQKCDEKRRKYDDRRSKR